MMRVGRAFVPWRRARQLNHLQPVALDQRVDRPIHRGDADAAYVVLCGVEHFLRTERSADLLEDASNGVALSRVALHEVGIWIGDQLEARHPHTLLQLDGRLQIVALMSPSAPVTPRQWIVPLLLAVVGITVSVLLDRMAWHVFVDPRIYERDWGRLLRVMGYLPVWLLLGVVVSQQIPTARWRGAALAIAPALAGVAAELLKLLLRRERPPAEQLGAYVFRPWSVDPLSTKGLGLPSSHVMVAIAAAVVLSRCFPKGRWLWYGLAIGCGLSRVAARAHFLSDVTVALIAGWAVGASLWSMLERRNAPRAGTP
jgi:membrane-associated phospholipid phosphatase